MDLPPADIETDTGQGGHLSKKHADIVNLQHDRPRLMGGHPAVSFLMLNSSYQFGFLKKYFIRQDLQDYHDFCAFPEERPQINRPADINFLPPEED
jgi:hypothetical protein